jgi:alkylhydroperoxidase family enzyme
MGAWQDDIMARTSIDAVTTELVRLRAAQRHGCHT